MLCGEQEAVRDVLAVVVVRGDRDRTSRTPSRAGCLRRGRRAPTRGSPDPTRPCALPGGERAQRAAEPRARASRLPRRRSRACLQRSRVAPPSVRSHRCSRRARSLDAELHLASPRSGRSRRGFAGVVQLDSKPCSRGPSSRRARPAGAPDRRPSPAARCFVVGVGHTSGRPACSAAREPAAIDRGRRAPSRSTSRRRCVAARARRGASRRRPPSCSRRDRGGHLLRRDRSSIGGAGSTRRRSHRAHAASTARRRRLSVAGDGAPARRHVRPRRTTADADRAPRARPARWASAAPSRPAQVRPARAARERVEQRVDRREPLVGSYDRPRVDDGAHRLGHRLPARVVERAAAERLAQRDAEAVLIGARVDVAAELLLRRHVAGRAHHRAGLRQRLRPSRATSSLAIEPREAEVRDARAARRDRRARCRA